MDCRKETLTVNVQGGTGARPGPAPTVSLDLSATLHQKAVCFGEYCVNRLTCAEGRR